MRNKIKDNKGSTLVLAIMLVTIVSIVSLVLYSYVINQIKITKKTQNNIDDMYEIEGGIEKSVAEFISNINIEAPSSEVAKTEIPDYIPNDSVLHRLGRYVLTLVEEIGIINGNMSHNDKNNMNATKVTTSNNWKNISIGNTINNNLISNLNTFNDGRVWYILHDNRAYIKNETDLNNCRNDLIKINNNLDEIEKALESELKSNEQNRKLSIEEINKIKKNLETIKAVIKYIKNIVDKNKNINNYSDYEYFISPEDNSAENLNSLIDDITNEDLKVLSLFLEDSLIYIDNMPNQIKNLNSITYNNENVWSILNNMSKQLRSSKDTLLTNIKSDLNRAKEATSNELKLKYIVSASIKINKIIVIIGKVQADQVLNGTISNQLEASTNSTTSIARINVQNARRTLKGSQIICDFLQYKLSKAILNQYSGTNIINDVKNEIEEMNINNIDDDSSVKIYNLISNKMNNLKTKIENLERIKYSNNYSDYVRVFDEGIKNIISTYVKNGNDVIVTQRDLSEIILILQEQYSRLCELNDKKYNQENYANEVKLNESINKLKNLEVIYNHLSISNNYTTTTFNSENNCTIKFSSNLDKTNNSNSDLYVEIDNIDAKVKIKNSEDDYYLLSSDDINKGILSVNPSRNLEFNLEINSSVSSKSRTKVNVNIYIENIVVKDTDGNNKNVDYDISYKILGLSREE